jgi:hypothetical protein
VADPPACPRIVVTAQQLNMAFRVWMIVAPSRFWQKNEKLERLKAEKRHTAEMLRDPRGELTDYMAEKFLRAGWEESYPEPAPVVDRRPMPAASSTYATSPC